ncbi:Gfo/Idh/MocA family oxidoreductase [Candidatus Pristimantibacillus sp. PTI5]|uniref:Gfo/Idh/MocA family oxidoreductase n=1 Tax=Candidatus Pristimantibacillus sp. PTI5 TaxID=3400422 RepID=UPI003B01EA34
MSTENKTRIGMIGAGNIGNVHAGEFSKLGDDCVITAVTDLDLARAEKLAKQYGIENVIATNTN